MLNQFQQGFASGVRSAIKKDTKLTIEDKEQLKEMIEKTINSYFTKFRVEIKKIMPLDELVTKIYIPVYKRHFNIAEIQKITSFYKSPIGQKFISVVPALMQESMTMVNQKYTPQLQEISSKLAMQELAKLKEMTNGQRWTTGSVGNEVSP